jgi:asparagine synthase (glutamine-hydrolysing)
MCGITLAIARGGGAGLLEAVAAAHHCLRHRGPDGEGWLLVGDDLVSHRLDAAPDALPSPPRAAAAFRRLIIQDASDAARQPLASPDGRAWILHNGEIYNHDELRDELRALGHAFRSSSDAEVALAAYRVWGADCFARFNGMWAILIVDLARGVVVGSRDPLGIKPLFYTVAATRVTFASEPAALAATLPGGPRIEAPRFAEFLCGLPPQSNTGGFFAGVHPVPPGTYFEIDLRAADMGGDIAFRRFWDLAVVVREAARRLPLDEAAKELGALLGSAVDYQARAAVRVGCLLSGGLDSSTVATLLAQRARANGDGPVPAYSIVYDDPVLNEAPYIKAVAERAGLRSRTYTLSPAEAWDLVDPVVRAQGHPLLGQDVIAQYTAYGLARGDGSVVVLEGQGSDEMFGGLPRYEGVIFQDLVRRARVLRLVGELRARARHYDRTFLAMARRYVAGPFADAVRDARRSRRYRWLEPGGRTVDDLLAAGRAGRDESPDPSALNRYLYRLVRHTNLPVVLQMQDRSSMAHGVESRVPFLDHRVVELAFRLPESHKVDLGIRKRVLLEVSRGLLPDAVLERRDKKVFVSRADWVPLRAAHAEALRDMARARRLRESGWINGAALERFVEGYLGGRHDDGAAVWRLYTAWRWLEAFTPS